MQNALRAAREEEDEVEEEPGHRGRDRQAPGAQGHLTECSQGNARGRGRSRQRTDSREKKDAGQPKGTPSKRTPNPNPQLQATTLKKGSLQS